MIKDISVTFMHPEGVYSTLLLGKDFDDLLINLTSSELRVYLTLLAIAESEEVPKDWFLNSTLAKMLNVSANSVMNAKSKLKQKGYLLITIKEKSIHVLLGKESIEDYLKHTAQ